MAEHDPNAGLYSLTEPVVLAHPNLFEARAFGAMGKESGTPKFSGNFVFKPDSKDLAAMKAKCAAVARAAWPNRAFTELKFPFSDGTKAADERKAKSGKNDGDYQRGMIVLAARSKYEPNLAGLENSKPVDYQGAARAAAKPKFYFGVYVLSSFNFVAYKGVGANPDGVTAYLQSVFTTGKGKRLNSGAPPTETFKGVVGQLVDFNPEGTSAPATALEDEIPF